MGNHSLLGILLSIEYHMNVALCSMKATFWISSHSHFISTCLVVFNNKKLKNFLNQGKQIKLKIRVLVEIRTDLLQTIFNLCSLILQVHFRGYPSNVWLPCEGEDSTMWSFINPLKEVSCVISSVYARVYDGTCLIYNMMSNGCSTFQRRCLCIELYAFTGIF